MSRPAAARDAFTITADDGVHLSVVGPEEDAGPPAPALLLVHGSGCGFEYWDVPVADHSIMRGLAAAGLAVYAIECRGYGRSDRPPGMSVTAARMAADVVAVMAAIVGRRGGGRVGLAGHSSGATVALLAAAQGPVSRLALLGMHYRRVDPRFSAYAAMMAKQAAEPGRDYVANPHYRDVETRLGDHEAAVVAWYKHLIETRYPTIPGAVFRDILADPIGPVVPALAAPTLLVNGTRDYVVDPDDALDLFRDLGCAEKGYVTLSDSYHLPFLERRGHAGVLSALRYWFTVQQDNGEYRK